MPLQTGLLSWRRFASTFKRGMFGVSIATLVALLAILGTFGCRRAERVTSRYWRTDPIGTSMRRSFPEQTDRKLSVARTTSPDATVGVCFSGGGVRSAAATLGQLRALRLSGLIDHVSYISCVSGGSWAAVPYTFVPHEDDDTFLGCYVKPRDLTRADFDLIQPGSYASALSDTRMPTWLEGLARLVLSAVRLRDNEWFGKQLEKRLLKPFNLDGRLLFVTQDEKSRRAILRRNLQLTEKDFRIPDPTRPFLIVNGTIRRYDFWVWDWNRATNKRLPFEMTPLYVGVPHEFQDIGDPGRSIGGTYVEPLAYGADEVETVAGSMITATLHSDPSRVESQRFNIVDMMTISGSAPAEYQLAAYAAFPWLPVWSCNNPPSLPVQSEYHADGGLSENCGIMPLLARRVKNIVVFVNAEDRAVPNFVRELFGEKTNEYGDWHSRGVFPNKQLADLEVAIGNASRGVGGALPFHTDTYHVATESEDLFNIHLLPGEDYEVNVAWFFLDSHAWLHEVPPDVEYWILGDSDFENFPHYKTFLNSCLRLIDPSVRQVNALAHLTSWLVMDRAPAVRRHFGL